MWSLLIYADIGTEDGLTLWGFAENKIPSTDRVKTEDHYYSNDSTALYIISMSAIPGSIV